MRRLVLFFCLLISILGMTGLSQTSSHSWALVTISVGSMRTSPKYASELATQAVMGTPVKLLQKDGSWWEVETPEGYTGWMFSASLSLKTAAQMHAWRETPRLIVTNYYQIPVYKQQGNFSPRNVLTDLVANSIVEGNLQKTCVGQVEITLPDGRKGWADADSFMPLEKWAAQDFNADKILNQAYALEGVPYLWGGTSSKATDCSGLVKVSYLTNGYILKRDASQQARTGTNLSVNDWRNYEPGDLVFFGNKSTGKITHVGIYDCDGMIIHCSGCVKQNSIVADGPNYLGREIIHAVRINGNEGTEGIMQVRNHPWYFN